MDRMWQRPFLQRSRRTIRHWYYLLLLPVFLSVRAPSIGSADPSTRPEEGDLFKGESVNMYFYQNRFFSFDMTIPGDWHALSTNELLQLLRKESPGGGYSEEALRSGGQFYLVSISRYRPTQRGPGGELNPNIMVAAMDLSKMPGVKTARDHIEFMKSMMKAMGVHPKPDALKLRLGGIDFWRIDGAQKTQELRYYAYVSTIRRGYALTFQLAAGSKGDMDKLDHILKSLNFE